MSTSPGESREVFLPERVFVEDLAKALHLKPLRVVADLMDLGFYVALRHTVDFSTAANVCSHHGVAARPLPDTDV